MYFMQTVLRNQIKVLPEDAVSLPDLHVTPSNLAMRWSSEEPIVALIASRAHSGWSRWSIIAPATGKRLKTHEQDAMELLEQALGQGNGDALLPNWIGYLSYEVGYSIEPVAGTPASSTWPFLDLMWCDQALVHDNQTDQWWSIGGLEPPPDFDQDPQRECRATPLVDPRGDDAYLRAVEKTVAYIHAGDIFQANITRRFESDITGDIRQTALNMLSEPGGWFGAWFEFPDDGRFVLSMSPELFLSVDGESGSIVTRPMKGTRPEKDDPAILLHSEKDKAELHMIVDLMRNDLGRVCEFGSMEVSDARALEQHPTVWQCVGEVRGVVRKDCSPTDILRATFPAGSITGAPKVRAMQIINELEATPRGPYCGAIGIFGKSMMLSVGIRTAMFKGDGVARAFNGTLQYSTGCGIVADSLPEEELLESEVKTHIMHHLRHHL